MTALGSVKDFAEGDLITIIWDKGDEPIYAQVITIDRGFIVYTEIKTGTKGVARPNSPYKIEKREL